MRLLLLALTALCACPSVSGTAEVPTPPRPTRAELAAPAAPPPEKAAPASSQTPATKEGGWRSEARVVGTQRWDEFVFLGWSEKGTRYAFSWWWAGHGGATCGGEAGIAVVDAARDEFVPDGYLTVVPLQPDPITGICDPPDLRAEITVRQAEFLARHGMTPLRSGTTSELRTVGARQVLAMPDGRETEVISHVVAGGRDVIFAEGGREGAGLHLTLRGLAGVDLVLDDGSMRRPGVWDYLPIRAFWGPDGSHGAFLTERISVGYEGDRHAFGTDGLRIPNR